MPAHRSAILMCLYFIALSSCGEEPYQGDVLTYELKHMSWTYHLDARMDILFVIDNSPSMAGKQDKLLGSLQRLVRETGYNLYMNQIHIAVITTSMESDGCPMCTMMIQEDCHLPTDLNLGLRDYLGHVTWSADGPSYDFTQDETCQVVSADNLACLFDEENESGTAAVGTDGCPFRHGLSAMRHALLSELNAGDNAQFLREGAVLAVVYISDGEDCGDVGDVSERVPGMDERICSYAANGVGPGGETSHPEDPNGRPYELTPVDEYYEFLMDLKDNQPGLVKFMAVTGVSNTEDPSSTAIEYESTDPNSPVVPACTVPNCTRGNCDAVPGTRAIELAQKFGHNGFVDTICQEDILSAVSMLGQFGSCPRFFYLDEPVRDPDLVAMFHNDQPLPRHSCSVRDGIVPCASPGETCEEGICVETWHYHPPDQGHYWPMIEIADHADPCSFELEHPLHVEVDLWYVAD